MNTDDLCYMIEKEREKLVAEIRKQTAQRCADIAYGPHNQTGNAIAREIEKEFGL